LPGDWETRAGKKSDFLKRKSIIVIVEAAPGGGFPTEKKKVTKKTPPDTSETPILRVEGLVRTSKGKEETLEMKGEGKKRSP